MSLGLKSEHNRCKLEVMGRVSNFIRPQLFRSIRYYLLILHKHYYKTNPTRIGEHYKLLTLLRDHKHRSCGQSPLQILKS